jgi:hypothetical protein
MAETEHDRLTKQARLYLSPPEVVFEELRKQAQLSRSEWFSYDDKEIERTLLLCDGPCFAHHSFILLALIHSVQ